jgi:hypothetical protein
MQSNKIFSRRFIGPICSLKKKLFQPPRNKIENNVDIKIILPYSAKKNNAKTIDEYSKLNPATNSASASGKSNGALFVSAKIETRNGILRGNSEKRNQVFC